MICVSVLQESRKLSLVDMLNAAPQCDLIELRLDKLEKAPDIKEFLSQKRRPLIVSCRRPQDGGFWTGSETERLALLRQCIIDRADYVEIEHDVADQIRPFPGSQRVISFTNMGSVPENLGDLYDRMRHQHADVIKLTTLARTPEEAWPLVQLVARTSTPTVIVGLGKPGIMLSILGKKVGAPWTYAALEHGLEAYPGQVTVRELNEVYRFGEIDKSTRLVGVTGFSRLQMVLTALLNAGFAAANLPSRCLPLALGDLGVFRKVIEATKLAAVVLDDSAQNRAAELASSREPAAEGTGAVDLLVARENRAWHGYNLFVRAALGVLEEALRAKGSDTDKPLSDRMVLIVGGNALAASLAYGVRKRGGLPILAVRDRGLGQELAARHQCRYVPLEAIYATTHDLLVICSDEALPVTGRTADGPSASIHPGVLRPGTTLLDLTTSPLASPLAEEAQARGCHVVHPRRVLLETAMAAFHLLTGRPADRNKLEATCSALLGDA
ncbi:MAG TPA: type I 3-dehydroquinate dehydratase [Gemmatales bacterium]|nr:type I 3-dehydroquinate dehydratase [Gemmatales bacterium]